MNMSTICTKTATKSVTSDKPKNKLQCAESMTWRIFSEPTIKKSIGKWKKVKKIFFAKKHSKASYLQIAGLRYKN